ncbi:MAG: sugar ABC transporter permease, partial [SAR324 cluster bacterium]|nr:sugar ABC transporter permease [SAR324 cluster bacterium]
MSTRNHAIQAPIQKSWFIEHNNWVFLLPTVLFFVWYQVYPIVRVVWISFTDYKYLTNDPANWVGFDNYVEALSDPLMWAGLGRAAYFTAMFLPGTIIIPLLLAVLIHGVQNQRL